MKTTPIALPIHRTIGLHRPQQPGGDDSSENLTGADAPRWMGPSELTPTPWPSGARARAVRTGVLPDQATGAETTTAAPAQAGNSVRSAALTQKRRIWGAACAVTVGALASGSGSRGQRPVQWAGLRGTTSMQGKPENLSSLSLVPKYAATASMINTPNDELERALQSWDSHYGPEFLFVNERYPSSIRIATDQVGVRSGTILAVGGSRAIADVTTVGEQLVTGLIQVDRSPLVVLQVRFMAELARRAPTRDAFVGVLKDVMFGDPNNSQHQRIDLVRSIQSHGVEGLDPGITDLFERYLSTNRSLLDSWGSQMSPLIDSFAGTAFQSDEAFAKVKLLAQYDRVATIVVDLNDPKSVADLDARLKIFGDNKAPAVTDVSNAHWLDFTGRSPALCDLIKNVAKEDESNMVVFTDNGMNQYSGHIANSANGGTGRWVYYAASAADIVEERVFPSCWAKILQGHRRPKST